MANITFETLKKHASPQAARQIDKGLNDNGKTPVFYCHCPYGHTEEWAHEIVRLGHTGWFTQADGTTYKDGTGLARGIVLSLPPMPGYPEGRFLAGYWWGDNDERVIYPELYSDKEEAARAADSHAERWAAIARDDNEKFEAARTLENDIEDGLARLRECLVLRHRACMAYVRDEARELCESIRTMRETLRTDYADYV